MRGADVFESALELQYRPMLHGVTKRAPCRKVKPPAVFAQVFSRILRKLSGINGKDVHATAKRLDSCFCIFRNVKGCHESSV